MKCNNESGIEVRTCGFKEEGRVQKELQEVYDCIGETSGSIY